MRTPTLQNFSGQAAPSLRIAAIVGDKNWLPIVSYYQRGKCVAVLSDTIVDEPHPKVQASGRELEIAVVRRH